MALSGILKVKEVAFLYSSTTYVFKCGYLKYTIEDVKEVFELIDFATTEDFYTYRIHFELRLGAPKQQNAHTKGAADIIHALNTTEVEFHPCYTNDNNITVFRSLKYKVRKENKNFTPISSQRAGIVNPYSAIQLVTKENLQTISDLFNF
jgi:hypothetical protein